MNRSELITQLAAAHSHLTAKDVEVVVKMILDTIGGTLAKGQRIEIRGFGSFCLNRRPPCTKRNPKTGKSVLVPAKNIPRFKAGKELRERVNKMERELHGYS